MSSNSSSQASVTTILAGVSVALSLTSLVLSWRTWRNQCQGGASESMNYYSEKESERTSDCSSTTNKSLQNDSRSKKNKDDQLSHPLNANHNHNNSNTKSTKKPVRATLENQILQNHKNNGMLVQPIGVVRSIYRLCVGTPRQGLLAPHARGRIELAIHSGNHQHQSAMDAVIGLEQYSHIWIVFVFHLNTLSKNQTVSAKIAPPALGGTKVGVLATRSPHRFNPIGITLAKLDRIEVRAKNKKRNGNSSSKARVVLHISGLDLVDGTPVLDIKPFVPHYDTANPLQQQNQQANIHHTSPSEEHNNNNNNVRLPPWVSDGLATRRTVTISEQARNDLQCILAAQKNNSSTKDISPLEFYGTKQGDSTEDAIAMVLECIREVLSIDVRSSWQTKRARQGKYQAQRAHRLQRQGSHNLSNDDNGNGNHFRDDEPNKEDGTSSSSTTSKQEEEEEGDESVCTQQLDNLLLHYTVAGASQVQRGTSQGSGAEDKVCVTSILQLPGQY